MPPRSRVRWTAALLVTGLFALRLGYGLGAEFWAPDERQIYLLGLKFFTTGAWPYFGPDVVYTESQIPGALQALLVGLPLFAGGLPEAPIVFLNLLSFSALGLFAWYLTQRFPELPRWFVWSWLMLCPWTLLYGTGVVNPSYVLPFAIVFFIGLFEACRLHDSRLIRTPVCFLMMGVATTATMQLHLSWVLLPPITAAAFVVQARSGDGRLSGAAAWYLAGAAAGIATLLPTYFVYGLAGTGGTEQNIVFNPSHAASLPRIIGRFFSFAAFELPRLLGHDTAGRLATLRAQPWIIPLAVILLLLGVAQVLFFVASFFRRGDRAWRRVRMLFGLTVPLVYVSFLFSIKGPSAHTYFLVFPLSMLYSFHCYARLPLNRPRWRRGVAFLLFCAAGFHAGLALQGLRTRSLYVNRAVVVEAIARQDYRILGLRRADEWGRGY